MSNNFRFEVNNFNQVIQALEETRERALTKIGMFVNGEAQDRCPVLTSYLKNSLTYIVKEDHVKNGTNTEYGPAVHNGTRWMRARSFLKDAAIDNKDNIERIAESEYRRGLG
jgi:HK97 gp10 family phage protein